MDANVWISYLFFWPCLKACGVLVLRPDKGLNPPPVQWKYGVLPLDCQGSPPHLFFFLGFFMCWVFVAGWAFSSCRELGLLCSCGSWASHYGGFSCCGAQALGTWASVLAARRSYNTGSNAVHRLNCSAACAIFPEKGLNPCLLYYQVDLLSLSHQGSPQNNF